MSLDRYRYGAHFAAHTMQKVFVKLRRSWRAEPASPCLPHGEIFRIAAEPLGIECRDLGCDAFELRQGGRVRRFQEMTSDLENAFTYWVTGHKKMTFEILREAGITEIPRYTVHSLATVEAARRDFRERGKAVVVKPCFGTSGGLGVTVGIRSERELDRAMYTALCHDRELMMEDFVEGDNFRLLVLSGRLISAVRRLPASVTGDGVHTIEELVERENARRSLDRGLTAMFLIEVDSDLRRHLRGQGRSPRSVPKKGERVVVKSVSNFSSGGETEDVTDRVCGATIDLCRRVATELGVVLAGIDLITTDIGRPLGETGGVINEVNTSPGFHLHYAARNGGLARDVAREVLLELFPRPAKTIEVSAPRARAAANPAEWTSPQA